LERGKKQAIDEEDKKPREVDMESLFLLRSEFGFDGWFVSGDCRMVVILISDRDLSCRAGVIAHKWDSFGIDTKAAVQIGRR
jgi:hypothetical protein